MVLFSCPVEMGLKRRGDNTKSSLMSGSFGVLPCDVVTASIELNPTALLSNTLSTSLERVNVIVCVCVWKEYDRVCISPDLGLKA